MLCDTQTPTLLSPLERANLCHWIVQRKCLLPLTRRLKQIQFPKCCVCSYLEFWTMVTHSVILDCN
jgi:hypothetical protein